METASRVAGSMQRSATGSTRDGDRFDVYSERMERIRMRRRADIDTMFELPNIFLRDGDIDWVRTF